MDQGTIHCNDCNTHFAISPGMVTDGLACSECGGKRLFMDQPSPTQSDGTLRDMVDSDSQIDQGGNPLGEGTIMGNDGERNQFNRDNFMHSNTSQSATESVMDRSATFNTEPYDALWHERTAGPIVDGWTTAPGGTNNPMNPTPGAAPLQQQMGQEEKPTLMNSVLPAAALVGGGLLGEGLLAGGAADAAATGGGVAAEDAASTAGEEGAASEAEKEGGGLAKGLVGQGVKGLAEEGGKGIGDLMKGALGVGAGGAGLAAPSAAPTTMQMGASTKDIPMILLADFETMDSVPSVDAQQDDPSQQDQKQFHDGDMSPSNFHNPNLEDSGAMGEDNVRSDSAFQTGFSSNSPGIERANMIMPLLMQYYHSNESGERDPLVKGLHQALEQENPGYLTQSSPESKMALEQMIHEHHNPSARGVHAGIEQMLPGGTPTTGTMPGQAPVNPVQQPQMQGGACPTCGGVLGPDGSCPQCGNGNNGTMVPPTPVNGMGMGMTPMAAIAQHIATHQGPVTPEQIAAVQEILVNTGRDQECPNVPLHPEQYAKEMAEIQQQPNIAPQIDPSQLQQTPPPAQPQAPGGMPVTDPSQAGGGGMPMQPMSSQRESIMEPGNRPDPIRGGIDGTTMAVMKNNMDNGMDEETALQKAMEWAKGMEPTGYDMGPSARPEGGLTAVPRTNRDYQGVQTDKMYNLHNPLQEYKVPALPEGLQLPQQHNDPYLSRTADANTMVPRCPNCGSGSTSVDATGDPSDATPDKGLCHSCHTIFDPTKEASVKTADANTMTPRCPQCGSGSTRVDSPGDPTGESDEPQGYCPSCGLMFDPADPKVSKVVKLTLAGEVDLPNPAMQSHEPHMKWADVQGQDLMAGQTYELHSAAFSVPTEIRVMNVKPDGLDVQLIGGVGNETGQPDFKISRQEAQMEKYEFVPTAAAQHSVEPDTTPGISPEQVPPLDTTDQTPDAIPHTHTESSCQKCGSIAVDTRMLSPEVTAHDCVRCANHWETQEVDAGTTASVDLSWINQSDDDDFFSDRHMAMMQQTGNQSRNIGDIAKKDDRLQAIKAMSDRAKLAGKTFSPSEKRELIDERGSARNLEDLDLEGTHYDHKVRVDYTGKANDMNVDDDHFSLGF